MTNTAFSVEVQGLNLTEDVKGKVESALRSAVLSEIAKTDEGKDLSVQSLPVSSERSMRPILGFILKNLGGVTERSAVTPRPSPMLPGAMPGLPVGDVFTPQPSLLDPHYEDIKKIQEWFRSTTGSTVRSGGAPLVEVLESLYLRPDIQEAVGSNSRALAELLSRDEEALQAFNELTREESGGGTDDTERNPFVLGGIAVVGLGLGIAAGYLINRPK